jgi:hypothetical protein
MKPQRGLSTLTILATSFIVTLAGAADTPAPVSLRYALPPGKTNAYNITITQQGESGRETMTGTLLVSTAKEGGYLAITVKGQLRPKMTPGNPMMMGYRPGAPVSLNAYLGYNYGPYPEAREVVIDETGQVLRLRGDSALPVPLGSLLTSFLTRFPAEPTAGWEKTENVYLMDEPILAGPLTPSVQNFGSIYYNYGPGRPAQATVTARQKTTVKVTDATQESVTLQEDVALETLLHTGNEPRISGSAQTKVVLDRSEGWPRLLETEAKSAALTENLSRSSVLSLKWQLLEGAQREAALTPPPPRPQEIPAVDIAKLIGDLQSDNTYTRQNAARELTMTGRTVKPTPELMALAVKLCTDRDDTVRRAGQTLVANYGTREQVPLLLRALKETTDSSTRNTVAKGLGRLGDPRAAEPLVEMIAAGPTDQSSYFNRESAAAEALIKIGPPAESAVLPLLKEKNANTRIIACNVLKQIGSKKSLSALKELTGNQVKEVSEAAAEAARSIQGREKAQ